MSLVAVILAVIFFALVWHDEPVRPPVIERRVNRKQLPHE